MHEWLSGGVSPCQGEGRGFESRLVLSKKCEKEEISDGYLFFCMFDPAGFERFEVLRSAPDVRLRRLVLSIRCLFFACSSLVRFERFEVLAPICSSQETSCAIKNYLFFQKKQATSDFCAIMLYYEKVRCIKRGE